MARTKNSETRRRENAQRRIDIERRRRQRIQKAAAKEAAEEKKRKNRIKTALLKAENTLADVCSRTAYSGRTFFKSCVKSFTPFSQYETDAVIQEYIHKKQGRNTNPSTLRSIKNRCLTQIEEKKKEVSKFVVSSSSRGHLQHSIDALNTCRSIVSMDESKGVSSLDSIRNTNARLYATAVGVRDTVRVEMKHFQQDGLGFLLPRFQSSVDAFCASVDIPTLTATVRLEDFDVYEGVDPYVALPMGRFECKACHAKVSYAENCYSFRCVKCDPSKVSIKYGTKLHGDDHPSVFYCCDCYSPFTTVEDGWEILCPVCEHIGVPLAVGNVCIFCGARFFEGESKRRQISCCQRGRLKLASFLPFLPPLPLFASKLYPPPGASVHDYKVFGADLSRLNSMFAFSSVGGNVVPAETYQVHGRVFRRLGPLVCNPDPGQMMFANSYFVSRDSSHRTLLHLARYLR